MRLSRLLAMLPFVVALVLPSACKQAPEAEIYGFTAQDNKGGEVQFKQFKGKVLLIVNTASRCGFTPQYEGLESLYRQYKDQGLVVIGFPCNQFGNQEPGTDAEIAEFCSLNYGVSFPIMSKIEVNGDNAHPLYKYLTGTIAGNNGPNIEWNFTKFLVSRDGTVTGRYGSRVTPAEIEEKIKELL